MKMIWSHHQQTNSAFWSLLSWPCLSLLLSCIVIVFHSSMEEQIAWMQTIHPDFILEMRRQTRRWTPSPSKISKWDIKFLIKKNHFKTSNLIINFCPPCPNASKMCNSGGRGMEIQIAQTVTRREIIVARTINFTPVYSMEADCQDESFILKDQIQFCENNTNQEKDSFNQMMERTKE